MSNKLVKQTILVFIIIIGGKILTFFRDIIVTFYFGANEQTDSYFVANNVPSILYTAIISSILVLFIPLYKEIQVKGGNIEADKYASRILNMLIIFSLLLTCFGIIFQEQIISIIAPGYTFEQKQLTYEMCNILLLSFPFSSISLLLANISNANNKNYSTHIIPIISSIVIIISLFIFHKYGIFSLIYSSVFAYVIQLIVQVFIVKTHFRYHSKVSIFHKDIKLIFILIFPVFMGYTVDQINLIINTSLCTYLSEGSVSYYNYAIRFQNAFVSTISLAVVTVLYPVLSELFFKDKISEFRSLFNTGLKTILYLTVPLSLFLCVNSESLIKMVYGRGRFDEISVAATSAVFSVLILSLIFLSIKDILIRMFIIRKDTKSPLIASIIFGVLNVSLGYYSLNIFGLKGLAFAYVSAAFLSVTYLLFIINRSRKNIRILNFDRKFIFNCSILLLLPVVIYLLFKYLFVINNDFMRVFVQFILLSSLSLLYLYKQKDTLIIKLFETVKSKIYVYIQK